MISLVKFIGSEHNAFPGTVSVLGLGGKLARFTPSSFSLIFENRVRDSMYLTPFFRFLALDTLDQVRQHLNELCRRACQIYTFCRYLTSFPQASFRNESVMLRSWVEWSIKNCFVSIFLAAFDYSIDIAGLLGIVSAVKRGECLPPSQTPLPRTHTIQTQTRKPKKFKDTLHASARVILVVVALVSVCWHQKT